MKFTREDIARIAGGYPQGTVYNWEEKGGGIPNLALVNLKKIGCDLDWLLTGTRNTTAMSEQSAPDKEPANLPAANGQAALPPANAIRQADFNMKEVHARRFIVPGKAAAFEGGGSLPGLMSDDQGTWDDIHIPDTTYFVKISGDSMSPLLLDGQYAMMGPEYLRNSVPPNRSLVIAQVTVNDSDQDGTDGPFEGVYCKRIIDGESCWWFRSINPAYRDFTIHKSDCRLWPVIGVYFAGHGVPPEEE